MRKVFQVSFFGLLFMIAVHGQSTHASLTGRITDPKKAVITGASVTVINTGTGIHYQGLTNEIGEYYVTNLPPGRYRIEVEKLGFKAVIQSNVILHVQDALEVNFEMMLGSASESVTVAGESSPIDTESSSVGTVVEQRKANELPLNGRNVFNLIVLAPSVIPQGSSTGTPVGVNPFGWGNYQVSGSFGNQSAEYLDGQPLNIGYINLPVLIPTQDSIQEFKVQTSNLGAEWGRFAGGVTNLSTKGGTNYLHGEAYEYLRNRIFNANDYFLNAAGKPRPPWVQNQFGAEAGGPCAFQPPMDATELLVCQLGGIPASNRGTIHGNRSNPRGACGKFLDDQRSYHGSLCWCGKRSRSMSGKHGEPVQFTWQRHSDEPDQSHFEGTARSLARTQQLAEL